MANMAKHTFTLFSFFLLSVTLTFLNKVLVDKSKTPYALSSLHALVSWVGCLGLLEQGNARHQNRTTFSDRLLLGLFSLLYTINIGIGNLSSYYTRSSFLMTADSALRYMTPIALHQLLRAPTPAITALLIRVLKPDTRYSTSAYLYLGLVIAGVVLATAGGTTKAYQASAGAVLLTILGAFLAAVKSIAASALQGPRVTTPRRLNFGLGLSALEILKAIAPLACVQSLVCAWLAGELRRLVQVVASARSGSQDWNEFAYLAALLLLDCLVAFGLNVASLEANRGIGPLAMAIVANLKQVSLVVLGGLGGVGAEPVGGWSLLKVLGVSATVVGSVGFVFEGEKRKRVSKDSDELRMEEGRG